MNKQWNKDGLTRKKLENDFRIHEPFQVLEKNLSNLLARAFSKSSFLYHYQSLAILNEIKQTDTIGIEQSFILWQNENSPESNREITYLRNALYHKFSDWYQRLNHRIFRDSMSDLFLDMEKYNQRLQLITRSTPKRFVEVSTYYYVSSAIYKTNGRFTSKKSLKAERPIPH